MLKPRLFLSLVLFLTFLTFTATVPRAQSGVRPKPTPTPAEQEETEEVFIEEVRLPVFAYDDEGRFDSRLEIDDVLVVEDDVPQQVKSVQRVPASVLLLFGTGWDLNPVVRASTTRDIGLKLMASLRDGDRVAAVQYSAKPEVLQGWTGERAEAARAIRSKLQSGSGSNLSLGIKRAVELLREQPVGNRHLVLVADGIDTASSKEYEEAVKRLVGAQITLHVISYSELGRLEMKKQKRPKEAPGMAQSRADMATVGIDPTRPPGMRGGGINPPDINSGIRIDPAMRRQRKAAEREMKRGESRLKTLTEETGGRILMPASVDEMVARGEDVAREIDAQYVITYKPKRPLRRAPATEYRRIHVGARRLGLQLRSRRGYVVGGMR
jgi:VWFA-related protein